MRLKGGLSCCNSVELEVRGLRKCRTVKRGDQAFRSGLFMETRVRFARRASNED
jgi:hypothetical protein